VLPTIKPELVSLAEVTTIFLKPVVAIPAAVTDSTTVDDAAAVVVSSKYI